MSQFYHLVEYPYLQQFCQKEQIPLVQYAPSHEKLTLIKIVAYSEPDDLNKFFKSRRMEIEECLKFAYMHNILDKEGNRERISRLKSNSPKDYWSTLSELMIGVWLENQGLNIRCVEPPSLGNGKGDYLVEINGNFVFVEIKTLFGEKETLVQEEMLRDIVKLCRDKQFPVEDVHLFQYPSCYDYKNEKETLLQDVEGFIRNLLPVSHRYIINFNNKSGIWMRIRIAPDIVLPTSFGVSRVAQIQDYLSERLDEDDVQVSKENIPSICVINNCDPNIQRLGIERFLYGTTCDDYTKSEKPIFRQNDGRWSGDLKSELNAMVILSFESNSVKIKTSDAYLCPNPKYTLSNSIFSDNTINWWKLDSDGISIVSSQA